MRIFKIEMTEVNAYIFAFIDFQKHGKREENNLLWCLSQTEMNEAQKLDEDIASEMYEYMKLLSNTNHNQYNTVKRTIRVYNIDKDEFIEEEEFDKILKELTIVLNKK